MKKINNYELERISGGKFVDGFCVGIGVASIVGLFTPAAPVAAMTALGVISGGCTVYALTQLK